MSLTALIRERAADLAACHRAWSDRELGVDEALRLGLACGRLAALEVLTERGMLAVGKEGRK